MTASSDGARTPRSLAGDLPVWASGLVTGGIGILVSLLVVVAPTLAAVASAPDTGTPIDWGAGMAAATRIWLLGFGVPATTAIGTFSLIPLGLTALNIAVLAATSQRFLLKSWGAVALAVGAFAVAAGGIASLSTTYAEGSAGVIARAILGAVVIGVPGVVLGRVRSHGLSIDAVDEVPQPVRAGVRAGLASLALALVVAAGAGAISAFRGASEMADMVTALGVGGIGAIVLAVAQLMYLPTLVVWMLAWVSGVGFSVSEGSAYSPGAFVEGPLPQLPLLGALPHGSGGSLAFVPLLLVLVGVVVRTVLRKRIVSWQDDVKAGGVMVAVVAAGTAILMALGSGAAGQGGLASVGPAVWPVAGAVAGLVLVGYAIVGAVVALNALRHELTMQDDGYEAAQPASGSTTP